MRTLWFALVCTVAILSISPATADVNLIIAHSNDLLFQIDDITADNKLCNRIIPTPAPTVSTTLSTTESTTTATTPTTISGANITTLSTGTQSTTNSTTPETASTQPTNTTTSITSTPATTNSTQPTTAEKITTATVNSPSKLDLVSDATSEPTNGSLSVTTPAVRRFRRSTHSESVLNNSEVEGPKLSTNVPVFDTGSYVDPVCYGGVARHLSKINELKQMNNNSIFIHLNAGGMLGGSVWFPILGVDPMVESIQALNYTAVGLGYRDFDEGIKTASSYLNKLKGKDITVLCSNVDTSGESTLTQLFKKYTIINNNGFLIGIVGFIGTDADYLADTGGLKFTDEISAIQQAIDEMLEENNNVYFIIAIGSAGLERAKEIQRRCLAVDVIISGGGKNVFLYDGQSPLNETSSGTYPLVYESNVKQLLVQTSRYGKYLGLLNLTVNSKGQIVSWKNSNPILLNNDPDPTLLKRVDEWRLQVKNQSDVVIGHTKVPIVTDRHVCWYRECNGGNLVADAVLWYLTTRVTTNETWKDSVAAVVWHSGALSATDLGVNPGPITFGDILAMCPFANTLTIADMTGTNITTLFEKSFEFYNDSSVANLGEFLHFSGLQVQVDLTRPKGSRVVEIKIRDTTDPSGNWSPLNPSGKYRVGMPSFIARGGSRFVFMENIPHIDTDIRDEHVMKLFIEATSPYSNGVEGRLTFVRLQPKPAPCNTDVTGTVFLTIFLTLLVVGSVYVLYKFIYPRIRDRRGSLLSLIR